MGLLTPMKLAPMKFDGARVTVMGLGHFGGGVAAARWLARRGASVTVTDLADRHVLAKSLAQLRHEPIERFRLKRHHEEDFLSADLVVVNPAVRPENPFLEIARQRGARLTSEIGLFLDACPAKVVGVTGTNGKSTTAAMIAAIFEADGRRTWLGGNIGASLLERLGQIRPDDWVVLELSSFQLWHLGPHTPLPHAVVVTNCSPNHLDWHGCYEHYVAAKQRILTGQTSDDLAVLGIDKSRSAVWETLVRGKRLSLIPEDEIPDLAVPGGHNRANAIRAATAALGVGCRKAAVRRGLSTFAGLPGRLELVATIDGRRFYNDTTSTTPESTVAALETLGSGTWLLAGGSDKGGDLVPLSEAIVRCARGAALFGTLRDVLAGMVRGRSRRFPCTATETMDEALRWCWRRSSPGESILLSPACSSHDQFQNFRERGARFVASVRTLVGSHGRSS